MISAPAASAANGLSPILGPATQLGYVVRDVEVAMKHWIEVFGLGPFLFLERGVAQPAPITRFRGEDTVIEMRLAFAYHGDVQIELIEQTNDAPSPYREFLARGGEGLQHLGFWVHDHEEACRKIEAAGYHPAYVIPMAGQPRPIIYYDSPAMFGPMLELTPPEMRRSRQAVRNAVEAWKGGDPIIRFDTYASFLAQALANSG
ncbi:VOC family protein [Terrarubrum flagellatum]|uniref:VOC family protein n=1 Tax=Terrirubrum flagellatum TaxID=2895980 RepID=UPI0031455EAE